MKTLCILLLFFGSSLMTSLHGAIHELFIIIHGTWAQQQPWAQPGGDFFEVIRQTAGPNATVASFSWTGKNNHAERLKAAEKLTAYVEALPASTSLTIIAHSHGGNIAFLASQKLAHRHIDQLFALGTPIDRVYYRPNMNMIGTLYNLFSFGDPVQTVSGYFGRTLPAHPRCSNVRLKLNEKNPNHAQLHCPLVAQWLGKIPELIALANKKGDTEMPPFITLELFDNQLPQCHLDSTVPKLLEDEQRLYAILAAQMLPRTKANKLVTQRLFGPLEPPQSS